MKLISTTRHQRHFTPLVKTLNLRINPNFTCLQMFSQLWLVHVHCAVAFSLITSDRNTPEQKNLYCREARQMSETIKQKVLDSYGACKFSHTFPMEKSFKYSPLKLSSWYMFVMYCSEAVPRYP